MQNRHWLFWLCLKIKQRKRKKIKNKKKTTTKQWFTKRNVLQMILKYEWGLLGKVAIIQNNTESFCLKLNESSDILPIN